MKKQLLIGALALFLSFNLSSQVGFGVVMGNDLYQRYTNPEDDFGARSAGNAILNLHFGPKFWVGGQNFSVSVESYINWGATAFSLQDYKGMGALAIPVIGKLNFAGNSAFNSEITSGWSIGGGYQLAKTELYGLNSPAANEGIVREYYPVIVGEISHGYGFSGFVAEVYLRYGVNTETMAKTLNIGISYNFNTFALRKTIRKLENFD